MGTWLNTCQSEALAFLFEIHSKKQNSQKLRQKYKITLAGPNVLCSMIQAFHLGFQTLKIQKHAKQIYIAVSYTHLTLPTNREV